MAQKAQKPKFSQERRLQILQAAARVISERGLADTRVADVAKRAGSSAALIIYYFESKDRLLSEALTYAEDSFYLEAFHQLAEYDRAGEKLTKLIEISTPERGDGNDLTGDWTLWIELWSRALRDPEAGRKRAALDRRWRMTISDIVRSGQRAGEFAEIDAEDFAVQLAALLDGLALQVVLDDPEVSPTRMKALGFEFASRALGFETDSAGVG